MRRKLDVPERRKKAGLSELKLISKKVREGCFLANKLRIKSISDFISESESGGGRLRKSLGLWDLVSIGVGAVVGTGIFAVVGTAVAGAPGQPGAGTGIVFSFVIAAVACLFTMLCYAEFASMIPVSGSAYTYCYASMGEASAWVMGWVMTLEYGISAVAVAISWSQYVRQLLAGFGITMPDWICTNLRDALSDPALAASLPRLWGLPVAFNLPAFLAIALATVILVLGIRESSTANNIIVFLKFAVLLFFIAAGCFYVTPANWSPFLPNGLHGVLTGTAVIFFAYIGVDAVSTAAEETKNPERDLPRGMIWTLVVATVLYVLIALVLTGMAPAEALGTADPLARAFALHNVGWAAGLVSAGAVISMSSVILITLMGQTRIFYVISRDGLLPGAFSKVHPKFKTPHVVTIFVGGLAALAAAFANISEVVDLCNIGTLFAFSIVCAGVMILRRTDPGRERRFRCPGMPFVPIAGILISLTLMVFLPLSTWILFGVWILLGWIVYLAYGSIHSRMRKDGLPAGTVLARNVPHIVVSVLFAAALLWLYFRV